MTLMSKDFLFKDDRNDVHPLVSHIKNTLGLTWKQLGAILKERMQKQNFEISLSVSNVRNFSTNRSSAWWFWPEIGEMVIEMWYHERNSQEVKQDPKKKMTVDLHYAELFSPELMQIYGYWYNINDVDENYIQKHLNLMNALNCSEAIMNSLINDLETFFEVSFPEVIASPHLN
ncbi:hypothetical protein [Hydrogenovibrio marinus]|uniref:Uncharacterized protein n=1 Tax=Hydrogenovibrio marinus TaxID=28885 RepID=A0A066ZLF8_HYDMR|nr:hypothetical protein [Hydrogenovibrio marinus]KDN94643.1 hypothetical protein EI16_12140 [Hydrogenovibrio marinus]